MAALEFAVGYCATGRVSMTCGSKTTDQRNVALLKQQQQINIGSLCSLSHEQCVGASSSTCRPSTGALVMRICAAQPQAADARKVEEVRKIPRSIHDISSTEHILGFGPELAEDHPGYHDEEYKRRRTYIGNLARSHKIGEPIPFVDYSIEESKIWGEILEKLVKLYPTHACKKYLETFSLFNFVPDRIPQLEELSQVLMTHTGWQIRPVAGLLHPADFLNGLAFRTFHSTQYVRHGSNPMYTPEPDVCHEVLGHIPLLADPEFAEVAQIIGMASLGASKDEIWHLSKLYWYTVEFGTAKEENSVKAFGAGLLSSFGELKYMLSGEDGYMPIFDDLDPFKKLPKMSYKDGFQRRYFLCQSFSDVASKLRAYAKSLERC